MASSAMQTFLILILGTSAFLILGIPAMLASTESTYSTEQTCSTDVAECAKTKADSLLQSHMKRSALDREQIPCNEEITGDGVEYRGCQAETQNGRTCQRWDAQSPHKHSRTPARYPSNGLTENYCRNPDGEPSIWCYTADTNARWELCDARPASCSEANTGNGEEYRGCQTEARSGKTCQRWDAQSPHKHSRTPANYPSNGLVENYCRNPDGEPSIWCYTTDAGSRWEYCDAMLCAANQKVSSNACEACPAGTTNGAGDDASGSDTTCDATLCDADQKVSSNACVACPAGKTNAASNDASGSDTTCDATLCAADQKVSGNVCVACPAGKTNALGDDASGSDTTCDATLCAADQKVSGNVCVACPAGKTNALGDDASGSDTTCDATLCPANQKVSGNVCVACPAGKTNAASDDASGSDTTCDATLCPASQKVSGNVCVACPAGKTNGAGDDASGSDTACDPILCPANRKVINNVCEACPAGKTGAAGADASGSDTTCDATLCAANQRVSNNACVACPAGTTNAAGDDASGSDTTCDGWSMPCEEAILGNGVGYRGCQTETRSGRTCQRWDAQSPHEHSRTPARYPSNGLTENYCRNPDSEPSIWCYTTDSDSRWEYCSSSSTFVRTDTPGWTKQSIACSHAEQGGWDRDNGKLSTGAPAQCMASCASDSTCRGLSWRRDGSVCFYFKQTCGSGTAEHPGTPCSADWCNFDYEQ